MPELALSGALKYQLNKFDFCSPRFYFGGLESGSGQASVDTPI